MITRDHIGGLFFLLLCSTYGYSATQIPMLPGDEFQPFNAQTLPIALACFGGFLAICMLVTASRSTSDKLVLTGLDFVLVTKLLGLVVLFAVALKWIGFLLATIVFLAGGYRILGERRLKVLFLASVPFAVGLWMVLARLLDIYLAPGRLFTGLFGG